MGEVTRAIGDLLDLQREVSQEEATPAPPEKVMERKNLKKEIPEIDGLLGRAYKKLYVDARPTPKEPRNEDYDRAYQFYLRANQGEGGEVWHGVNLIALAAFRDVVIQERQFTQNTSLQQHAQSILENVKETSNYPWDLASRAEALLATGANKDAREALQRFLEHPETGLSMVQSTRRQFREMWQLKPDTPPGNKILPMLDAAYAQKGGPLQVERLLQAGMDGSGARRYRLPAPVVAARCSRAGPIDRPHRT